MTAIQAQYAGTCSACDEHFGIGASIVRDDTRNGWMHETCPDAGSGGISDPLAATGSVCASCFMVQPCGCDD